MLFAVFASCCSSCIPLKIILFIKRSPTILASFGLLRIFSICTLPICTLCLICSIISLMLFWISSKYFISDVGCCVFNHSRSLLRFLLAQWLFSLGKSTDPASKLFHFIFVCISITSRFKSSFCIPKIIEYIFSCSFIISSNLYKSCSASSNCFEHLFKKSINSDTLRRPCELFSSLLSILDIRCVLMSSPPIDGGEKTLSSLLSLISCHSFSVISSVLYIIDILKFFVNFQNNVFINNIFSQFFL